MLNVFMEYGKNFYFWVGYVYGLNKWSYLRMKNLDAAVREH